MPATFLGLNTARSGLDFYQASLNTTAHNISNAEVEGYSRQRVIGKASRAVRIHQSAGMQGTGVTITDVVQIRNPYYDVKYWNSNSLHGEYAAKYDYSYEIETYFNEMNSPTGYTSLLTNLQNSMKTLSDDPSSATTRVQYVNDFQSYTELFNELANDLQITQRSLNDEIVVRVEEINTIAKQLFSLNDQITNLELRAGNANDLRDQRMVLIDQLSAIVNVTTQEVPIIAQDGHDSGATRFIVKINNQVLVDDLQCNQLMAVPRDEKVNDTDIDGLYELNWRNSDGTPGDKFDLNSPSLTGKLAGLAAVRDGNNNYGFVGKSVAAGSDANGTYLTMETDKPFYLNDLNIPEEGKITVYGVDYYYDDFEAQYDNTTGEITSYTFRNLRVLDTDGATLIAANPADIRTGVTARIGESVDFEGIPYYMAKLNEFVRNFSRHINDLCVEGVDFEGNQGLDMMNTVDTDGNSLNLSATVNDTSFTSKGASYYRLTALNWDIHEEVVKDPKNKVVVSRSRAIEQGNIEDCHLLDEIKESLTDHSIFKEGTPFEYLESVISTLGVQTQKCKVAEEHQNNIVYSINYQRLSESSVDANEEASYLIIQQNGYNLSCKVMSVLDEIYDKLINGTGV
ncbi:MAG: flagellar hook-associated protein FlgK [Bacteroides sp.]|nr:flagellar hook-associated protein FlgK [Bacteroides sp.]MCM1549047.1 flagellar hook-associated protein FlgK [Clostridium sp.]